jgi:hypothetical protein
LCAKVIILNDLSKKLNSPAILTGKAAEGFYERWAKMEKDPRSKEELEESMRKTKRIIAKMKNPECLI